MFTARGCSALASLALYHHCDRNHHSILMQDALSESLDTALESLSLQPRICDHELLPPEVWVVVIEHCTRASQRACLSLSRAFHRRALPLLFREIVVSFGAWESWVAEEQLDTTDDIRHLQQLDEARSSRAYDILRRITLDPSFAGVIRSLEIEAYMRDGSRGVTEKCQWGSPEVEVPPQHRDGDRLNTYRPRLPD